MSVISKKDKKTWENYISNFKNNTVALNGSEKKFFIKKSISSYQSNLSKRGKIKPEEVIDLHGFRLSNAYTVLQKYIASAYDRNIRSILVITGKGYKSGGALKKEVPFWLNDKLLARFIIDFKIAPKAFGGEGALLVRVKNKNKKTINLINNFG